jgi:hypothetical protein
VGWVFLGGFLILLKKSFLFGWDFWPWMGIEGLRSVVPSGQRGFGQMWILATCPRFRRKILACGWLNFPLLFLWGEFDFVGWVFLGGF